MRHLNTDFVRHLNGSEIACCLASRKLAVDTQFEGLWNNEKGTCRICRLSWSDRERLHFAPEHETEIEFHKRLYAVAACEGPLWTSNATHDQQPTQSLGQTAGDRNNIRQRHMQVAA